MSGLYRFMLSAANAAFQVFIIMQLLYIWKRLFNEGSNVF